MSSSAKVRKLLFPGLIMGWLAAALIGFVAYNEPSYMKYFLAMNFLMLAYTMVMFHPRTKKNLEE